MTRIVNLHGGPGVGKSTMAAGIFFEMKKLGVSCELVNEYAKELVWEKQDFVFNHQLIILGNQYRRIARLINQVEYVITDSPILLGCTYLYENAGGYVMEQGHEEYKAAMCEFIAKTYNTFDNIDILMTRDYDRAYQEIGRRETFEKAQRLDKAIEANLIKYCGGYMEATQLNSPAEIINHILY